MSIQKNTLINVVGAVVPMVVMLVTVPLYLNLLGEARYGVLALVWLVLGYFSFLELGLGKATANQIAKAHNGSAAERSEIFWTALLVNAAMGAVGAGLLWLAGDYLITSVLKMPEDFRQETAAALPWMIASLPLVLVSSVLNGALEGRNKFLAVNLLQVATNSIFQTLPLGVAYWFGPSLAYVVPAAVGSRAAMNVFFLLACYWHLPLVTRPRFCVTRARSLFSYGGWVALTGMAVPLLDTVERLMIGVALGASAVTHYTVPMQLVGKIKVLPGGLARALFPAFSSRRESDAHELAVKATKWLAVVMALAVIVGALALRPFLDVWIGKDLAKIAAPIGELLLIGVWMNSVAHIPYFYLQATGRPDLVAKLHGAQLIPYIIVAWLAIDHFGLIGATVVWVMRCGLEALTLLLMARIAGGVLAIMLSATVLVLASASAIAVSPEIDVLWRLGIISILVAIGLAVVRPARQDALVLNTAADNLNRSKNPGSLKSL